MSTNKNILYCSFCGKSQHEVRKLIAGPTVFICDECVELCMDIIKEESKENLFPLVPAANKNDPILAAWPIHKVETSGFIYCIVS